jgi:hypothetical protein
MEDESLAVPDVIEAGSLARSSSFANGLTEQAASGIAREITAS